MNVSSLFPGYKHVESFGPDEDYEEEVEESYLTLDLLDVDPALIPNSETYRLIGLDTPTPFLQLSGTIMKGTPQTLLGTQLVFREADNTGGVTEEGGDDGNGIENDHGASTTHPIPTSGLSQNRDIRVRAEVVHFCSTEKRIRFREVKLQPKSAGFAGGVHPSSKPLRIISFGDSAQAQNQSAQNGEDGDFVYPGASEMQFIQEDPENNMEVDAEVS